MGRPGWFKVWRKIEEHWLNCKPFDQYHAWMDLLTKANFTDTVIPAPGRVGPATLAPGEAIVSFRLLEADWGWSRNRVVRFLKCLQNEHMISTTNEHTFTRLKVLNWKKYQGSELQDGDTDGDAGENSVEHSVGDTVEHTVGHNQEKVKKVKKEKNGNGAAAHASATPPGDAAEGLEDQPYLDRVRYWGTQHGWKTSGGFRCRADCPECSGKVLHVGAGFGTLPCKKAVKL